MPPPWASIAAEIGLRGCYLLAAGATAVGLLPMTQYRSPADARPITKPIEDRRDALPGRVLAALIVAGLISGLLNGAVSMILSFSSAVLIERGWPWTAAAGRATSLTLRCGVLSIPLGGFLADRSGRREMVLVGGRLMFAVLLAFALLGLVRGLPSGSILGPPAWILTAETRATGMGIFLTLFYLTAVTAP